MDKRLVLGGSFPAVLVGSLFGVGQRFNGVLPRPRGDAVVAARQIRFGNLEIQHRLAFGIIFGFDDLRASSALVVPRLVRLPVLVSTQ
jgi:hypothetical protein